MRLDTIARVSLFLAASPRPGPCHVVENDVCDVIVRASTLVHSVILVWVVPNMMLNARSDLVARDDVINQVSDGCTNIILVLQYTGVPQAAPPVALVFEGHLVRKYLPKEAKGKITSSCSDADSFAANVSIHNRVVLARSFGWCR